MASLGGLRGPESMVGQSAGMFLGQRGLGAQSVLGVGGNSTVLEIKQAAWFSQLWGYAENVYRCIQNVYSKILLNIFLVQCSGVLT